MSCLNNLIINIVLKYLDKEINLISNILDSLLDIFRILKIVDNFSIDLFPFRSE